MKETDKQNEYDISKVKLEVTPTYTRILEASPGQIDCIQRVCGYYKTGYERTDAFLARKWDGFTVLMWWRNGGYVFPTGLLPLVEKRIQCEKIGEPELKSGTVCNVKGIEYRGYQQEAIKAALDKKRGIIKLKTAGGKTAIGAGIIASLNGRSLWLCHEAALARQTKKELDGCLDERTEIYRSKWKTPRSEIVIGSVQSLYKHLKTAGDWLKTVDVLIVDEVHLYSAETYWKVCMSCPAPYRFGLSGTPLERSDNADLRTIGAIGPVIYERPVDDEEIAKYTAPLTVRFIRIREPKVSSSYWDLLMALKLKMPLRAAEREAKRLSWLDIYDRGIMWHPERNEKVIQATLEGIEKKQPTIVFVSRIDHGRFLLKQLRAEMYQDSVEFVYGDTTEDERVNLFSGLQDGRMKALICIDGVGSTGIDIPAIERAVVASGGKAKIRNKQRSGRPLRLKPGNKPAVLIDFWDMHNRVLQNQSKERKKSYEEQGATEIKVEDAI